ncbi:MAG: hypothetical protein AAGB93_25410 [Planctomycetota bacterium]
MRADDSPTSSDPREDSVDVRRVMRLWAPLAASWALMAMEPTLVIAAVSRLPEAKVNLAAWSSVVFPVSLVVEGPIIMMLAASTRLSTSWGRYRTVLRYGSILSALLTVLHALIAFTPLYDFVAIDLLGSKPQVVEPGRLGLQIMLPWTYAIGYRRTQQGLLIRFERSGAVGTGTLVRLVATAATLFAVARATGLPGVAVAGIGVATGVTAEAVYAGWRVREVFDAVRAEPEGERLTPGRFARFYTPLAVTPLVTLFIQPIGAAAMNRMPRALDSVAAWGPVHALVFTARSVGMAFNEVVVTLVALRGGPTSLRRFGAGLAAATSLALLVIWATPLAGLWFGSVQDIPAELVPLATLGAGLCILMPAYQVAQSWYQGLLVHAETTRPITEAVLLYFLIAWALLQLGVERAEDFGIVGLAWALVSFVAAGLSQTAWLWMRSRAASRAASDAVQS